MSETARVLGLPASFTFESKELKVPRIDFETEGAFEAHLEREALAAIERQAGRISPGSFQAQMEGWRRDCAVGVYDFTEAYARLALRLRPGKKAMAWLLLSRANPKQVSNKGLIDRLFADPKALALYEAAYESANADPNLPGPAAPPPPAGPSDS